MNNKRLIILIVLTIIWMIVIFTFSSKSPTESNSTSKGLIKSFVHIVERVTNKDLNEIKIANKMNFIIRKCAHFSLYAILGIFVYRLFLIIKIKDIKLFSIIFCLIYALSDELHQLYIPGRSGMIRDVLIDTLGSITAILILNKIYKKTKI